MRYITFNRIYAALLLVAVASALVNPKPFTQKARAQVQRLFTPISYPVRRISLAASRRLAPPRPDSESPADGQRSYQQIAEENGDLRVQIAHITEQLRHLQQINADREALGDLRPFCRPMQVAGADTGWRKAISLQGPVEGIKPGMAVLYPRGLAGKVDRVGWSMGVQAQLVIDSTYRAIVRFGRLDRNGGYRILSESSTLLEGNGIDGMVARNMSEKDAQAAGIAVGDFAVIADNDYPSVLQGYRIGLVTAIKPSRAPQYVEINVSPSIDLTKLSEVMVLMR